MNPFSTEPLSDADLLSNSDDGCSAVSKGRAVPPWLRTEMKWRVVPLARGQTALFPPPSGPPAEAFVGQDHLVGPGFQTPMVVLGPAGAGLTTFHHWIRLRAEKAEVRLVELDFGRIAQTEDPAIQRQRLASIWLGPDPDLDLLNADLTEIIDQLLIPGAPHAPSNDQFRVHVLLRVDRLHLENKKILLGRLRDLVECRKLEGARFAVLAHETAPLEDAEPFSSFLGVCEVYRLADFTVADVKAMWESWVPDRAAEASEVARQCVEWTGGQPTLVNLYLGRLFEAGESFDEVGAWLLEHPPQNSLRHWQRELARIVDESRLLRRRLDGFLREVQETVTREELPLFLAGWIGQEADGRWAIRSKAHAEWAKGPLHAPRRYYRAGGGER